MTDAVASTKRAPSRSFGSRGFYDKEVQGVIWQIVTIGLVVGIGWYLYSNMLHNLEKRQIQTGWDFLWRSSSFDIGESMIEYSSASPYWKALLVGQISKLEEKYKDSGQDLSSYLDGLLYQRYLTYWDYIHLDTLLSIQVPRTHFPDEEIFILYHQITELYFKLILHEQKQIVTLWPEDVGKDAHQPAGLD